MFNIFFGLLITIVTYFISTKINAKYKTPILNPVLVSTIMIIIVLLVLDIPYEDYEKGGSIITYLLGPIVVLLAVPLYKSRMIIKKYMKPIFIGIFTSIVTSAISVFLLSKAFGLNIELIISLLPKSITGPMALEASKMLGAIPGLTVIAVSITGIFGATIATSVMKYGKIKNEIAKGIGIGTSSHGTGTSKAIQISQEAGAASGVAMGLAGVITVLITSIISKFL